MQQFCAAVGLGARDRLLHQRQRLQPDREVVRSIGDFANADDDGDAVGGV